MIKNFHVIKFQILDKQITDKELFCLFERNFSYQHNLNPVVRKKNPQKTIILFLSDFLDLAKSGIFSWN